MAAKSQNWNLCFYYIINLPFSLKNIFCNLMCFYVKC
jgi:hypothetical protein